MLLTPLYIQAQNLNQKVSKYLCLHRFIIYWDTDSHQFLTETRQRHLFLWRLGNFGVIGGCAIPCSLVYLLLAINNPKPISPLKFLVAGIQLCLALAVVVTCSTYAHYSSEKVSFLNKIVTFEATLRRKYFRCNNPLKTYQQRPLSHVSIEKIGSLAEKISKKYFMYSKRLCKQSQKILPTPFTKQTFSGIWLANGEIDVVGILAYFLTIAFTIIPTVMPCVAIFLEVDFAILPFKQLISETHIILKISFYAARITLVVWFFVELCQCYRNFTIGELLVFRGLSLCHTLFRSQPIGALVLGDLRQLYVLFAVIWDMTATLFFTTLALFYVTLVIFTILLVTVPVPWQLNIFFILGWLMTAFGIEIILSLVVSLDLISSDLQKTWLYSCTQVKATRATMQLLYRLVKSVKPMGIPYGSLGTFQKATRTSYFVSVAFNSISAILAFMGTTQ